MADQDQSPDFIPYVPPINPRVPPPPPEEPPVLYEPAQTTGGPLPWPGNRPKTRMGTVFSTEGTYDFGDLVPPSPMRVSGPSNVALGAVAPQAMEETAAPKALPTLPPEEAQQHFDDILSSVIQENPKALESDDTIQEVGKQLADAMGWEAVPKPSVIKDYLQKVMTGEAPPEVEPVEAPVSVPALRDLGAQQEAGALGNVQAQQKEELETNLGIGEMQRIATGQQEAERRKKRNKK